MTKRMQATLVTSHNNKNLMQNMPQATSHNDKNLKQSMPFSRQFSILVISSKLLFLTHTLLDYYGSSDSLKNEQLCCFQNYEIPTFTGGQQFSCRFAAILFTL